MFLMTRRRARAQLAATVGLAAASAAVAAAVVYYLDPSSGKHRRAVLGDRVVKIGRGTYKGAASMYRRSKRHLHAVGERAAFYP